MTTKPIQPASILRLAYPREALWDDCELKSRSRRSLLKLLRKRLFKVKFEYPKTTWSHYRKPSVTIDTNATLSSLDPHKIHVRDYLVAEQLRRFNPSSVIDIAGNSGAFSLLAKKVLGKETSVITTDYDERAVSTLYSHNKNEGFAIQSALDNCIMGDEPLYAAEMGMAFALTHHLFLGQQYPFRFIAERLAAHTQSVLLTEFMPWGLSTGKMGKPEKLPKEYSLKRFVESLEQFFGNVEVVEYPVPPGTSPRTLIICSEKKCNSRA